MRIIGLTSAAISGFGVLYGYLGGSLESRFRVSPRGVQRLRPYAELLAWQSLVSSLRLSWWLGGLGIPYVVRVVVLKDSARAVYRRKLQPNRLDRFGQATVSLIQWISNPLGLPNDNFPEGR